MDELVQIRLVPLGKTISIARGTPLQDVLFEHGVEFPCGGRGRCRGCKVKVLRGELDVDPGAQQQLSEQELEAGWRLACRCRADQDLVLELAQWEATILADDSKFQFAPREGLGIAVDLGTTTVAAQLLDLNDAHVCGVCVGLNAQARHGADIMSRVNFALTGDGLAVLSSAARRQIGQMVQDLLEQTQRSATELRDIAIVGNTVMHHLFAGLSPEPLSHYPFEPTQDGLQVFEPKQLEWNVADHTRIRFLPCLGGFVGSDLLAGLLATRLHERPSLAMLIDLGTNGEIVLGNRDRMLCASTAAGPAFEGARISMGMRAATGAISEVRVHDGRLACRVIGNGRPRGICGSGLVDAVAAGLELGWIAPTGRLLRPERNLPLSPPVNLVQADIRELQLAKGAIAAGIRVLLEQWGANIGDVVQVFLAGAFGNYINRDNARRIGLFSFGPEIISPSGNTALLGAKLALFDDQRETGNYVDITRRMKHLSLSADPRFQEIYVEEMQFPSP